MLNQRQALSLEERAQIQRLIRELGEATTASALGITAWAVQRAVEGQPLNQPTRDRIRESGWVQSTTSPERFVLCP
jgi:hypothetical protein